MWWLALLWACPDEEAGPACPSWSCEVDDCGLGCTSDDPDLSFEATVDGEPVDLDQECTCAFGPYTVQAHYQGRSCGAVEGLALIQHIALPEYRWEFPTEVDVGEEVCVDASWSFEHECLQLSVIWTVLSTPAGAEALVTGGDTAEPCFTFSAPGGYIFALVYSDGVDFSEPYYVTVWVGAENLVPIADAGSSRYVPLGTEACLDGRGSFDPDGEELTYTWEQHAAPTGAAAVLTDPGLPVTCLVPDAVGEWTFGLVVSDGELESAEDRVTLTVVPEG